jgi:hypothetical protein
MIWGEWWESELLGVCYRYGFDSSTSISKEQFELLNAEAWIKAAKTLTTKGLK